MKYDKTSNEEHCQQAPQQVRQITIQVGVTLCNQLFEQKTQLKPQHHKVSSFINTVNFYFLLPYYI